LQLFCRISRDAEPAAAEKTCRSAAHINHWLAAEIVSLEVCQHPGCGIMCAGKLPRSFELHEIDLVWTARQVGAAQL
jgi:hypothetical protein